MRKKCMWTLTSEIVKLWFDQHEERSDMNLSERFPGDSILKHQLRFSALEHDTFLPPCFFTSIFNISSFFSLRTFNHHCPLEKKIKNSHWPAECRNYSWVGILQPWATRAQPSPKCTFIYLNSSAAPQPREILLPSKHHSSHESHLFLGQTFLPVLLANSSSSFKT